MRLRPFLRFARLPDRALATVYAALDDEGLRERVMDDDRATEERVGAAGAMFLLRPEGWEDALDALVVAAEEDRDVASTEATERSAVRRAARLEGELRAAAQGLAAAQARAAEAEAALSGERRARRAAEDALAALAARMTSVERERDAAHRRAAAAERAATPGAAAERAAEIVIEPAARVRMPPAGVRLPAVLPGGLRDDSVAAAEHLVRIPNAMLIIDGYNASLSAWPGLSILDQRARLIDALNELAARSGVDVVAVFDGEAASAWSPSSSRRQVRVRFSAAEEEADDVILAMVDAAPAGRPVVVATDDQRVRRESGARGANVVGQAQLFGVLRRER